MATIRPNRATMVITSSPAILDAADTVIEVDVDVDSHSSAAGVVS